LLANHWVRAPAMLHARTVPSRGVLAQRNHTVSAHAGLAAMMPSPAPLPLVVLLSSSSGNIIGLSSPGKGAMNWSSKRPPYGTRSLALQLEMLHPFLLPGGAYRASLARSKQQQIRLVVVLHSFTPRLTGLLRLIAPWQSVAGNVC
jgi:hypothetical protein